ncbi:MAG: hypothetical protein ACREQV_23765 [Candidatus Binatia bacterium]
MRCAVAVLIVLAASIANASDASDPRAVALEAITALFVENDIAVFEEFVAADAVQGDRGAGTALVKISKQRPEHLREFELSKIVFFREPDIDRLQASYPDDLWPRVREHIGDQQGVLVRFALTGEAAEHARAIGKDPRKVAMMTFVLSSGENPRIVHVDDN